jgi:hypothetical protein
MKTGKAANFWNWFTRFSDVYKLVHRLPTADIGFWMNELSAHLKLYANGEWQVDLEPGLDGGDIKMIFTAKRQLLYFDSIHQLVLQAPPIPGWKFHALCPPRHPGYKIVDRFGQTCIEPGELWVSPAAIPCLGGNKYFVNIYAELYDPADMTHRKIVDAMLFNILGERSFVLDLAGFKVTWLYNLSQQVRSKCLPLEKLPVILARMKDPDYEHGEQRKSA